MPFLWLRKTIWQPNKCSYSDKRCFFIPAFAINWMTAGDLFEDVRINRWNGRKKATWRLFRRLKWAPIRPLLSITSSQNYTLKWRHLVAMPLKFTLESTILMVWKTIEIICQLYTVWNFYENYFYCLMDKECCCRFTLWGGVGLFKNLLYHVFLR